MPERTELPDAEQLSKLFRLLLGPEDEWDEADAEIVLELHGVDPASLDDGLRKRLEREVEERRARGEDVPSDLLDVLAKLSPNTPY